MKKHRNSLSVIIFTLLFFVMIGCTTTTVIVPAFLHEKNGGLRPDDYTELGTVIVNIVSSEAQDLQGALETPEPVSVRELLLEEANALYDGVDDVIGVGFYNQSTLTWLGATPVSATNQYFIEGVAIRYN